MRALVLSVLATNGLAALTAQTTWTVDAAGGGHFTDIPPALAAAAPGDHIEVRGSGPYSAFVVARGVDVFAVARAATSSIEVVGVPPGQQARVTGFDVPLQGGVRPVSVRACAGSVLLADLREVGVAYQTTTPRAGLELLDAPQVFVHGGNFEGQSATGMGAVGLSLVRANAFVSGATIQGGTAVSNSSTSGGSGMPGVRVGSGCHLFLDQTGVWGGPATSASMVGGNGGDALQVDLGGFAVAVGQCSFTGPVGGSGLMFPGRQGLAITGAAHYTLDCALRGAVVTATSVPNRPVLRTAAVVPIGSRLEVVVRGNGGQVVPLACDLLHGYTAVPACDGAFVLTPQAVGMGLVALDASGVGTLGFTVPANPLLADIDVFCQGVADVAGALVLLAPAHVRTQ